MALALVGAGCLLHILAAGDYLVRAVGKARGLRADGQDPREHPSRRG